MRLINSNQNPTHEEKKSTELLIESMESPLGTLEIQANQKHLISVNFVTEIPPSRPNAVTLETVRQLTQYFAGTRQVFELPIELEGTKFQKQVWQSLADIPFGITWCYTDLAEAIGNPKAVRAVGLANSKNPISIIVPCHRVIGKNGSLTGYAGGLDRKAWLLDHEK